MDPVIEIKELSKYFGKFRALDNISIQMHAGQVISLLGPNGSGKTTLIKSILGLVIPQKGIINVKGVSVRNQWNYRSEIGYMPQIGRYPENMTIRQVFNLIRELRKGSSETDDSLYYSFGLDRIENKTMHNLSGGTRQKVSAGLAFLFRPPVFILDEPTAGLDPVSSELLKDKMQEVKKAGSLILITSHVLSDLEGITTDVVYLQDGKMIFNRSAEEILLQNGNLPLNKAIARLISNTNSEIPV